MHGTKKGAFYVRPAKYLDESKSSEQDSIKAPNPPKASKLDQQGEAS
jgi:hypothetical protein